LCYGRRNKRGDGGGRNFQPPFQETGTCDGRQIEGAPVPGVLAFRSQRRARFGWPAAFYVAAGFAAFEAFAWLAVNPGRALEPSLPSQAGF
jgi:hypothetical protein